MLNNIFELPCPVPVVCPPSPGIHLSPEIQKIQKVNTKNAFKW